MEDKMNLAAQSKEGHVVRMIERTIEREKPEVAACSSSNQPPPPPHPPPPAAAVYNIGTYVQNWNARQTNARSVKIDAGAANVDARTDARSVSIGDFAGVHKDQIALVALQQNISLQ